MAREMIDAAAAGGYPFLLHTLEPYRRLREKADGLADVAFNNHMNAALYNAYHALTFGMEVNHFVLSPRETAESGLAVVASLLKMGNRVFPWERYSGIERYRRPGQPISGSADNRNFLFDARRMTMDYHYRKERDPKVFDYFDKETLEAFNKWNARVFEDGRLDRKTKELVAVACAYMTRCPYCIEGHTGAALKAGSVKEEVAEVIQIAMAMSAGACIAHRDIALTVAPKESA